MGSSRTHLLLSLLLVTIVAFTSYGGVLRLGWCDHDAPVLVEVSRPDGPLDFLRFFGREVRDFVNPNTGFYRPWTNVSFALDSLLYGLDPAGYHLTDLLVHTGVAVLLLLLMRSLRLSPWIALALAVWFAAHPLGLEVVPSQPRRGDSWAAFFLLASCLSLLRARNGARRWWVAAAVLGALALFSKETGVVLPLLWMALPGPGRWWKRGLAAVGVLAGPLVLRTLALRGAGGYTEWTFWPWGVPDALLDLYDPFRLLGGYGVRFVALGMIVAGAFLWRRGPAGARDGLAVGALWALGMLGLTTLARGISAWYLYAPTVGMALGLAALLQGASAWGRARWPGPRGRIVTVGVGAVLLLPAFVGSPLFHPYPEWAEVSRISEVFLEGSRVLASDEVTAELRAGGETLPALVAGVPRVLFLRPEPRFRVRSSHALGDYSIRKALALLEGREVYVEALAFAHVNALGARWSIEPSWEWREDEGAWVLVLRPTGPIRMWPPRRDGLVAEGILGSRAQGPDWARVTEVEGALEVRELRAPVWTWDGERLLRVPPPPAKAP